MCLLGSTSVLSHNIEIKSLSTLTDLPSASAITLVDGNLYAVGDDSPFLYQISETFSIITQSGIQTNATQKNGRVVGKEKADLEAAEVFDIQKQATILMLGSGTYTEVRKKALLFEVASGQQTWLDLKPLFRALRKKADLNKNEFLNIEGLAANETQVFILSRGSHGPNLLFTLDKLTFLAFIQGQINNLSTVVVQRASLMKIDNQEATFSGAVWDTFNQQLLFTASVEANKSGQLLGSFVGTITDKQLRSTETLNLNEKSMCRLNYQGQPLTSKVESVVITATTTEALSGVLAADNDDGTSQFMAFELLATPRS